MNIVSGVQINNPSAGSRRISIAVQGAGLVFFGIMFYWCRRFAFERVLSFDCAYYIFQFIHSGKLFSGPARYGDYLPQLLPFFAFKQGLPLRTIIILYSVSFVIVHYLFFLIATLVLKNNGAGIAMMLASCLSYYHAFYVPMLQLSETMPAAILLWAFIHPEAPYRSLLQKIIYYASALAVIVYISFTHPLGIITVAFVTGMEMTGAKRYRDYWLWALIIVGMAWLLLKSNVFFRQQYDQNQIMPMKEMFGNLKGWKSWPSTLFVSDFTRLHFRSLKALALVCLLFSLRKGVLFFLFLVLSAAGFTFLLLANYRHGTGFIVYEYYYVMYGFFIGLAFVFLFYHPRWKVLTLLAAVPFLYTGLKRIYTAHTQYSDRVAYLDRVVRQAHRAGGKKYIIDSRCYPSDYAMTAWNFSFETLLYSSLQGADSTVTVFIEKPAFSALCDTARTMQNIFLGAYFSPLWFSSNDMPVKYIRLPSSGYSDLTHSQDDTSFHESNYSAGNLRIIPAVSTLHVYVNNWTAAVPVEIVNTSGHTIPAIPRGKNPVLIGFRLLDEKGQVFFDEVSNPLETDVTNISGAAITLYIPRKKGVFYATPDLLTEGVRWWHVPSKPVKIIID
ncbi:MAG: hypothetical protein HKL88_05745 [Bacteroidia bacterium]|nr:hypothetical protein [Bacteroidia bacterium]